MHPWAACEWFLPAAPEAEWVRAYTLGWTQILSLSLLHSHISSETLADLAALPSLILDKNKTSASSTHTGLERWHEKRPVYTSYANTCQEKDAFDFNEANSELDANFLLNVMDLHLCRMGKWTWVIQMLSCLNLTIRKDFFILMHCSRKSSVTFHVNVTFLYQNHSTNDLIFNGLHMKMHLCIKQNNN